MHIGAAVIVVALAATLSACSSPQTASAPPPPELTPAEKQAVLAAMPAPYNTADLKNGETQFAVCRSCHTIVAGAPNMTGPNLHGVFGRKAGTVEGFAYSEPLKAAGFVWDVQRLEAWITDPRTYVPGTKMTFPGLADQKDRTDLIAYLRVETADKPPNP